MRSRRGSPPRPSRKPDTGTKGEEGVAALIEEANRRIWERAVTDPATSGMGTTVTAALVDAAAGQVAIGHVGDSRAYLLRGGALEQLTTDHSLVAELVRERRAHSRGGRAPSAALGDHPRARHRAVGARGDVHRRGRDRRSVPPLLRRPVRDARATTTSPRPSRAPGATRPTLQRALDRRGERTRRRGQHHGRAVRARRGRA